jgi:tetratricopeptide (TPR) repeat protein
MVADPGETHDLAARDPATASRLLRELQRFPKGSAKPGPVDEETLRRLASLGYLGTMRESGGGAALPNPADNLPALRRMEEAWHLASQGLIPQAIEALRASVRENPGMFDAWVKLGELLSDSGQDDEAAAAYREALDRSPMILPDASVALGFIELRRRRLDEAERLARASLAAVPSKAHELLANVALARGNVAAAEREAEACVSGSRSPQPSAILVLADIELRAGKLAEALREVERAHAAAAEKRLGPIYNLEFFRGDSLARMERLDEAEAAFRAEIAAFPRNARAYASLAVIRFIRRDRPGLDRELDEMVRANPSPATYLLAATTLESLGEKEKAASFRRRAGALSSMRTSRR